MKGFLKTAKDSVGEFFKDNSLNIAAAIAYYALQSIIPLILGFIVIGSFFLQEGTPRNNFINAIKDALPATGGFNIGEIIDSLVKNAPGLLSVSALFLLWSGSGIFDQLIFGVNVAYDVKKDTRNFFVKLGLRFALLLIMGALIAAAFVVTIVFQLIFSANISVLGISPNNFSFLLPVISFLVPMVLMFGAFSILYKLGPDRKDNKWKYVFMGALVATILFEALKYGFTFYVTAFNAGGSYEKSYGALGGILLFLLYIWLSAAVMLLGAEVAAVAGGWKSVMEGPASQQDPGVKVEAEKVDSEGGAEVTPNEKAQGKDKPKLATAVEGKTTSGPAGSAEEGTDTAPTPAGAARAKAGQTYEEEKSKSDGKQAQPLPAYAASTRRYPAQADARNPMTIFVGAVTLGIAAVLGLIFRRKDPAA